MDRTTIFLDSVLAKIRELSSPSGLVLGSALGVSLKRCGLDWSYHGYSRLSDVLAPLQAQGLIRVGPHEQHPFAIWIIDGSTSANAVTENATPQIAFASPSRDRLRPDIWLAFISEEGDVERWFDRSSHYVRYGSAIQPTASLVRIPVITSAVQRSWAEEFLVAYQLHNDDKLRDALMDARWFVEFPRVVQQRDTALARGWKHERSRRVVEAVRKWCAENAIDFKHMTLAAPARFQVSQASSDSLRSALLEAIAELPLETLLSIPIPPKTLLRIVRPDLLQQNR